MHSAVDDVSRVACEFGFEGELHERGIFLVLLLFFEMLDLLLHFPVFGHDIAEEIAHFREPILVRY